MKANNFLFYLIFLFFASCTPYQLSRTLMCERIYLERSAEKDTVLFFKNKYFLYKNIIIIPAHISLSHSQMSLLDSSYFKENMSKRQPLTTAAEAYVDDTLSLKIVNTLTNKYIYVDDYKRNASVYKKAEAWNPNDRDGITFEPDFKRKAITRKQAKKVSRILKQYDTTILGKKYYYVPAYSVDYKEGNKKEQVNYLFSEGTSFIPNAFSSAPILFPKGFLHYSGFVQFGAPSNYSAISLDVGVRKPTKSEKQIAEYFRKQMSARNFNRINLVDSAKLFDSTSFTVLRRKRKMELLHAEVDSVIKARNIKVIHLPN